MLVRDTPADMSGPFARFLLLQLASRCAQQSLALRIGAFRLPIVPIAMVAAGRHRRVGLSFQSH